MGQSSNTLQEYVDALERQRKAPPEVDDDLQRTALEELRGVGCVVFPVDEGRWTLRANRDEDGAYIESSFEAS